MEAEISHLAKIEMEIVELNKSILLLEEELIRLKETYQEKLSILESQYLGTQQVIYNHS